MNHIIKMTIVFIQNYPTLKKLTQFCIVLLILSNTHFLRGQENFIEEEVDRYLEPLIKGDFISGSFLIAKKGNILMAKGYGLANREYDIPNTPETKFRIASVTKQFTASAIMILEQKRLLNVDDTIEKFLPDFPNGNKITIHHLLTHISGIPHFNVIPDYETKSMLSYSVDEVIDYFKDIPLLAEPGAKFAYSNSGYVLLTKIIELVSGKSYIDFFCENIFILADMKNTGIDSYRAIIKNRAEGYSYNDIKEFGRTNYRDMTFTSGAGSLYSTIMDLYLWDRALYTEKILTRESLEKMYTPYKEKYGYGWYIDKLQGKRVVFHGGNVNGFLASIYRFIDDDITVIILINYESTFLWDVVDGLVAIALGEEYKPFMLEKPMKVDTKILDKNVGSYKSEKGEILNISASDGKLLVQKDENEKTYIAFPQYDGRFFVKELNVLLKFIPDETDDISSLKMYRGYYGYTYKKRRK